MGVGVFLEVKLELNDLSLVWSGIDSVLSRAFECLMKAGKNTCPAAQLCSRDL